MALYIHTERGFSVPPDHPKWLDRRWRYYSQPKLSAEVRDTLIRNALREYGPFCHWCKEETFRPSQKEQHGKPRHRTLEHLIARGMNGKDTFQNTRIACYACNQERSAIQEYEIWIHRLGIMAPNRLFGAFIIGDEAV